MRQPLERKSPRRTNDPLDVSIANSLVREIIAMRHPPGSWLREQDIAARFGVSRSPVREALRHVARAGFVDMRPWRGAQVLALSSDETRHVFDLLEGIFGVVARIAAETLPQERFAGLNDLLSAGESALNGGSRDERVRGSFDLGRYLGRWSGSRTAYDMMIHVGSLALWQHRFLLPDDLITARRSLDVHRALVAAVQARDAATAEWSARTIVAITRAALVPLVHDDRLAVSNGD